MSSPTRTPVPMERSGEFSEPVHGDALEPTPEYVAAREAALEAVRAQKRQRQHDSQPEESQPPDVSSHRPFTPPPPGQTPNLARSYTDALAALDVPKARHVPISQTERDNLIAIYDDDEAIPARPMIDEANVMTTPVTSWPPLAPSPATDTGKRPITARQAARRAKGPAPGRTFAKLPYKRNPIRMGLGLIAAAAGLTLLLWYLPARAPLTPQEKAAGQQTIERIGRPFPPDIFAAGQGVAGGFMFVGALFFLNGLFFKPKAEVVCKRCKRYVIATQDGAVLKCPRSSHTARVSHETVLLTLLLVLLVGATFAVIALGSVVRVT